MIISEMKFNTYQTQWPVRNLMIILEMKFNTYSDGVAKLEI